MGLRSLHLLNDYIDITTGKVINLAFDVDLFVGARTGQSTSVSIFFHARRAG